MGVTPCAVAPPLLPWNAGTQFGAYTDQLNWRTPGPHLIPVTATPELAEPELEVPLEVGPEELT